MSSIPGSERSPDREWQPLQYSCLENSMNRGAWWATVHGAAKSQTRLSNWHLEGQIKPKNKLHSTTDQPC